MSETVHYKVKLNPTGLAVDEFIKDDQVKSWHENKLDVLNNEFYMKAFEFNGVVYKVECSEVDLDEDIFKSSINEDGAIDCEIKYYNGGCSFNDALEEALKVND